MKARLPAKELKYALTGLAKGIDRKASLPVLQGIRIETTRDTVRFTATDLDSTVSYTGLSAQAQKPGVAVIADVARLKELVAQATNDEVEITSLDETTVQVSLHGSLGDRTCTLTGIDPVEWPADPPRVATKPADIPFAELYRSLVTFSSRDQSRYVLNGIYVEAKDGNHTLVATDGRRLTAVNSIHLPLPSSVVLPYSKFLCWPQLDGTCSMGISKDGWFRLETGPWSFACKLVDGTYPNWRQVVPSTAADNRLVLADTDIPILDDAIRTLPRGDGDNQPLTLMRHGKSLCVAAKENGKDGWQYRELTASRLDGLPISVNRQYFHEAVRVGFREFSWQDDKSPLLGKTNNGIHVLMPLRSEAPPPKPKSFTVTPSPVVTATPEEKPPMIERKREPETPTDQAGMEQLQLAFQTVRDRVRDLNAAISELGDHIRSVKKQDKAVKTELDNARGVLAKLQSISL